MYRALTLIHHHQGRRCTHCSSHISAHTAASCTGLTDQVEVWNHALSDSPMGQQCLTYPSPSSTHSQFTGGSEFVSTDPLIHRCCMQPASPARCHWAMSAADSRIHQGHASHYRSLQLLQVQHSVIDLIGRRHPPWHASS